MAVIAFDLKDLLTIKPRYEMGGGSLLEADGPGVVQVLKMGDDQEGRSLIIEMTCNGRNTTQRFFYPRPDAKAGAAKARISEIVGFFLSLSLRGQRGPLMDMAALMGWLRKHAEDHNIAGLDFDALCKALCVDESRSYDASFYGYKSDPDAVTGDNYGYDEFIWIPPAHVELISQGQEKTPNGKTLIPTRQKRWIKGGGASAVGTLAAPSTQGQMAPPAMAARPPAPVAAAPVMAPPVAPSVAAPPNFLP